MATGRDIDNVINGLHKAYAQLANQTLEYWNDDGCKAINEAEKILKGIRIRKGMWIAMEDYDDVIYKCSVCREPLVLIEGTPYDNGMKYCPNCGAKMEGW